MSKTQILIENVRLVDPARNRDIHNAWLLIEGETIADFGTGLPPSISQDAERIDGGGHILSPGLIDCQVFIGEPGAEHRETLASAGKAAARGGVTTICTMPDTDPVIDDEPLVDFMLRRARDTSRVHVHPIAAVTKALKGEELAEIGLLKEAGAIAFSNGRKSIQNARLFRRALEYARGFDALIMHKPQDSDLVGNGVMHEGFNSTRLGLPGIPVEAETVMLDRDIRLAKLTGARYHASLLSSAEGVATIRRARHGATNISAGVSINNLTLNENDIGPYRTFYKLSPPLRSEDDRQALIAGLNDGAIDVIVSSHDPQDVDTKRFPFEEAAPGAVGLETLLSAALRLFHAEQVDLMTLLRAMTVNPANLLGLETGRIEKGLPADLMIFDPYEPYVLDADRLSSRSKNSPFDGARLEGRVRFTFVSGKKVFEWDDSRV